MYAKYIKRLLDIVLSTVALIILSPLLIVIAVFVKLFIGGPVFFRQIRVGKGEKPFEMIKFKTMLDLRNEKGELLPDVDRVSRFGCFLRSTSLDELPELFNVLKGDMSLIGPRPLYTFYLPFYTEEEAKRHYVRAGLTGLAQVNGRALCKWDERFSYDIEYVNHLTFLTDVKIFFKTILKVFMRSDVGELEGDADIGLHQARKVQRPEKLNEKDTGKKNSEGENNTPFFRDVK
ncbi:MAG: sugar transferase [Spirochaetales bacterium]|nr:sugar transferase [Spirochaetales bacterium]